MEFDEDSDSQLIENLEMARPFGRRPNRLEPRADNSNEMRMARPAGFEPAAPGLGILCSILLSYGRIYPPIGTGLSRRKITPLYMLRNVKATLVQQLLQKRKHRIKRTGTPNETQSPRHIHQADMLSLY